MKITIRVWLPKIMLTSYYHSLHNVMHSFIVSDPSIDLNHLKLQYFGFDIPGKRVTNGNEKSKGSAFKINGRENWEEWDVHQSSHVTCHQHLNIVTNTFCLWSPSYDQRLFYSWKNFFSWSFSQNFDFSLVYALEKCRPSFQFGTRTVRVRRPLSVGRSYWIGKWP